MTRETPSEHAEWYIGLEEGRPDIVKTIFGGKITQPSSV
jgi:hypothetical protein